MYSTDEFLDPETTEAVVDTLVFVANDLALIVTCIIFGVYTLLAAVSAVSLRNYVRKNSYVDYTSIISAPVTPSISVIAPAYNEERTIIENVNALMSLYYLNYEVIIVNDGSSDGSFTKLVEAFELERVSFYFDYHIPCRRIRGVYKSRNASYSRLTVIDKINGGKADALNAGINVSQKDLICSIDVDTILEHDALLKMVKPFMEETDRKVIGAGGVLRIVNNCIIRDGHLEEIRLPNRFLPRVQVLEYTRAFLLSRMAWSHLDGLLLISGALGLFDKEVVVACGGYSTETVGEDMELVVRMRSYMCERGLPYELIYVPNPLAWTEVPDHLSLLSRQRNRWTRGTLETLIKHRKLFMNPRYGKFGMLGYTYWLLFEWLAPIIEFTGYIIFAVLLITQHVDWPFFFRLFGFVYAYATMLNLFAILFEERTFRRYKSRRDVLRLVLTSLLEPFIYHPLTVWWAIRGNIDYLRGVRSWGRMERVGFGG